MARCAKNNNKHIYKEKHKKASRTGEALMVGNRGTARPTNEINILDEVAQPQQPALPLTSNFNTQADKETFAAIARTVGLTEQQTTIADETRANMGNAHVHGNSVAGGRRIKDGAVEAAAQDQNTPEAKKRKDIEAILRAAQRDLDEWIAQMEELIEQLREQAQEHYRRANALFDEADELEDLADAIRTGAPLNETQQAMLERLRRENPGMSDILLVQAIESRADDLRAQAQQEHQAGQDVEQRITEIQNELNQATQVANDPHAPIDKITEAENTLISLINTDRNITTQATMRAEQNEDISDQQMNMIAEATQRRFTAEEDKSSNTDVNSALNAFMKV